MAFLLREFRHSRDTSGPPWCLQHHDEPDHNPTKGPSNHGSDLPDIEALTDRLMNRADSVMLRDQPAFQADMRIAAKVLRFLIRDESICDPIELDA
jgi:hypothetical protein